MSDSAYPTKGASSNSTGGAYAFTPSQYGNQQGQYGNQQGQYGNQQGQAPYGGGGSPYAPVAVATGGAGVVGSNSAVLLTGPQSDWSSGLFNCLDDCAVCLYAALLPGCLTMDVRARMEGRQMELMDYAVGAAICICFWGWGIWCFESLFDFENRRRIADRWQFPKRSEFGQCLQAFFCCWCVACQQKREMDIRERLGDPFIAMRLPFVALAQPVAAASVYAPPPQSAPVSHQPYGANPNMYGQPQPQPQYYAAPAAQPYPANGTANNDRRY
eukprot:ANDGO_03960.mRNA.1 hypothetical protein